MRFLVQHQVFYFCLEPVSYVNTKAPMKCFKHSVDVFPVKTGKWG